MDPHREAGRLLAWLASLGEEERNVLTELVAAALEKAYDQGWRDGWGNREQRDWTAEGG